MLPQETFVSPEKKKNVLTQKHFKFFCQTLSESFLVGFLGVGSGLVLFVELLFGKPCNPLGFVLKLLVWARPCSPLCFSGQMFSYAKNITRVELRDKVC